MSVADKKSAIVTLITRQKIQQEKHQQLIDQSQKKYDEILKEEMERQNRIAEERALLKKKKRMDKKNRKCEIDEKKKQVQEAKRLAMIKARYGDQFIIPSLDNYPHGISSKTPLKKRKNNTNIHRRETDKTHVMKTTGSQMETTGSQMETTGSHVMEATGSQMEATGSHVMETTEKELGKEIGKEEVIDSWDSIKDEDKIILDNPDTNLKEKVDSWDSIKEGDKVILDNRGTKIEKEIKKEIKKEKEIRSPICCVIGHVDTGKTKLLDHIRSTNIQESEAGGITQQIGSTFIPISSIKTRMADLVGDKKIKLEVPGILMIDTPGHDIFSNLRTRGSRLCDLAILVIDIMHGIQKQTIESIKLLRSNRTPFIVALNKIDRIHPYWKSKPNRGFRNTLNSQSLCVQQAFKYKILEILTGLAEQGINAQLHYENTDFKTYVSVVPISALTGEGIPDMLLLLTQLAQRFLKSRLTYTEEVSCEILDVKMTEGWGDTVDVILVNGSLKVNDTIIIGTLNGPVTTAIRALLTPPPLRELRVKGSSHYIKHKQVQAAIGLKIVAPRVNEAVAGTSILVLNSTEDKSDKTQRVMKDLYKLTQSITKSGEGVSIQSSTLGSLEAIAGFLKAESIPLSNIGIGCVRKKDVIKASLQKNPLYSVILAFEVKVSTSISKLAQTLNVKIFQSDLIYKLCDQYSIYSHTIKEDQLRKSKLNHPCTLQILKGHIYSRHNPLILGVKVLKGPVHTGIFLCVPSQKNIVLGKITSIQYDHQSIDTAMTDQEVCIKIETSVYDQSYHYDRHFDSTDLLINYIPVE